MPESVTLATTNFIKNIINADLQAADLKKTQLTIHTRFPPEPNGYLHIGHAKSICLNFGIAEDYAGGKCNLRFDDTNPDKEEAEYTKAIEADIKWLGFDWGKRVFYASDYYEQLYQFAKQLILNGKAYVDHLSPEKIREYRGTLTQPGTPSPYRERSIEENLALFEKMRAGEFAEGECLLRAKIDMTAGNINMRDPAIYRIKKAHHHRTSDNWCIYPLYDYAHCLSDAIEGVTYSLCTLEFEDHRPLYNWFLEQLPVPSRPRQIEFARLNLTHTVTSKRKLNALIADQYVTAWDDPRMPTLAGMRRRGYTPAAIRNFCAQIGITKNDALIDFEVLEECVREDLNQRARRVLAVLNPLKVVIKNYPEDKTEQLDAPYHPNNAAMGMRQLPFAKVLYIEQADFAECPAKKFFRLAPGREVRLRYAYFITCEEVIKDEHGQITELHCRYDPETKGGNAPDGRKVKGTIHWVSARHALATEVRLYDRLFTHADKHQYDENWQQFFNHESIKIIHQAYLEPSLAVAKPEDFFQFERVGYFCVDSDTQAGRPIFNRTVTLRDSWKKQQQKQTT